jgi:hypothetical protein
LSSCQSKGPALTPTVRRPTLACVRRELATDRGATWGGEYGAARTTHLPRRRAREGTGGSWLEAVGSSPHGRQGSAALCTRRRPSRQGSWRASGALERGRAAFQPVNPPLTMIFFQKVELCDKNGRYEGCRGDIPLQYLQRPSYVFLDGLSRNAKQSSGFAER